MWQLPTQDNGRCSRNVVDWSTLDINIIGCRLSCLEVKHSCARRKILVSTPFGVGWCMRTAEESDGGGQTKIDSWIQLLQYYNFHKPQFWYYRYCMKSMNPCFLLLCSCRFIFLCEIETNTWINIQRIFRIICLVETAIYYLM